MITRFRLENFKAHRDTDLALHQFTVLVGDNSSGKTSVLQALRVMDALLAMPDEVVQQDQRECAELIRRGAKQTKLSWEGRVRDRGWIASLTLEADVGEPESVTITGNSSSNPLGYATRLGEFEWKDSIRSTQELIGRAALYRFHPDRVAASAYSNQPGAAVAEDGALTAVSLATLKLADDDAFDRIEDAMRRLVPSLQRVFIKPATVIHPSNPNPVTGSKLYFDFQGAVGVPAHHASQGTLVALALLTVLHGPNRPRIILLDDFDQSLHPRAQMELVRMIKELLALDEFKDTQIIATTHSPFVLDEVSPSDVIAFALRDNGTVAAKPLSEHPDAPRVNGSLKAGELWTLDAERDWVR
jgi:predicted ATPase